MSVRDLWSVLRRVSVVQHPADLNARLHDLRGEHRPTILSFVNQHGCNLAYDDSEAARAFLASDLLLRDGVGIEIAMKLLGLKSGINCPGTDLIPELIGTLQDRTIAVFGTREPWLSQACGRIDEMGVRVVSQLDGFGKDEDYLGAIEAARPDVVLLGMGMPRQEKLALKIAERALHPCLIINGGAILDFMAGRFPRAPRWMQAWRAEWLFRLSLEPRRLARRYVVGGARFGSRLIRMRLQLRRLSHAD